MMPVASGSGTIRSSPPGPTFHQPGPAVTEKSKVHVGIYWGRPSVHSNVWDNQNLPLASGDGTTPSTPPPPSASVLVPETPQSSQAPPGASNEAELTQRMGVTYTQTGFSLPEFYTSPIAVPLEITPIGSTTASSNSPEPVAHSKKSKRKVIPPTVSKPKLKISHK